MDWKKANKKFVSTFLVTVKGLWKLSVKQNTSNLSDSNL